MNERAMKQSLQRLLRSGLLAAVLGFAAGCAGATEPSYRQVVDGVAVYLGVVPAQLVRRHPPEHPEGQMHGGVPAGENHILVALFEDRTGRRITRAEVAATITGPGNFKAEKKLEPMLIAPAPRATAITSTCSAPDRIASPCVFEHRASGMTSRRCSPRRGRERGGLTMGIAFLGATGTVSGSRYRVRAGGRKVLVDGGLFQGYKPLRRWNRAPGDARSVRHPAAGQRAPAGGRGGVRQPSRVLPGTRRRRRGTRAKIRSARSRALRPGRFRAQYRSRLSSSASRCRRRCGCFSCSPAAL